MEPTLQNDPHADNANNPNRQFDQTNSGGPRINVVTGMLLGALVGGLIALLSSSNRETTKQSLTNAKSSVGGLVDTIKEDPAGKASQVIEQVKSASGMIQEVSTDVQNVYEKVVGEVDTVKEDVNKVVETAQETKSDLQDIGEKVVEAKDTALGNENATNENKPQA
ncbi:hypothetical protein EVJ27_02530 [Exiguobacterium sp. SH3S2]|uniref:YtxH domain-containing protein n=1 Tax=unclassified Exiguobacterium TaxID=2644629 RepID=UPI001039ACDD|nr:MULTISPECIES: YtxH domain-containing protein [unclassified Exiguobacterium]TCI27782.1 hypothetical protein EVJ32_00830 [Exiguobacterium sp. SH5S4]TCI48860.1 hypothetical protein EVJ28_02525 [Exiguobacterium sp. SH3S3]TCI56093.1 hypothetical protein EVJ30_05380 [Exiguobacterium sp. SH5S13]TCI63724.1 hypothetical protein EVJ27_02530 [Exiguobacterium sp. SH3S2]TCI64846.1 hypothetical protein EVJ26_03535 [Exiguobacterium sp. SH3S1]